VCACRRGLTVELAAVRTYLYDQRLLGRVGRGDQAYPPAVRSRDDLTGIGREAQDLAGLDELTVAGHRAVQPYTG
jgi:hypothetical protein